MKVESLTRNLKRHDSQLYADKDHTNNVISVFRKRVRYDVCSWDNGYLLYSQPDKYLIFSLTHNWKSNGIPTDWGIEPVMARIKAMDLWNRDIASDLIKDYEKDKESEKRAQDNNIESFLYDFRSQFAKATNDVNTSTLSKTRRI